MLWAVTWPPGKKVAAIGATSVRVASSIVFSRTRTTKLPVVQVGNNTPAARASPRIVVT